MTFLFVVGLVASVKFEILIFWLFISFKTNEDKSSLPKTVVKTTFAPAVFRCLATIAAPPT